MKLNDELEYLKLSKWQKFVYRLKSFFTSIPKKLGGLFIKIGQFFKKLGLGIAGEAKDIYAKLFCFELKSLSCHEGVSDSCRTCCNTNKLSD